MKQGFLSQYFEGVIFKRLSAVEADKDRSNQHEYNGTAEMKRIFGEVSDGQKIKYNSRFIWFGGENEGFTEDGFVTWYDARWKHPTRSEYRLYFPTTNVSETAKEGDLLIVAKQTDGVLLCIAVAAGNTVENQLRWLFNIPNETGLKFETRKIDGGQDVEVDFAVRYILDELGIEIEEPDTPFLDRMLECFGKAFPTTAEFSSFALKTIDRELSPLDDPDHALITLIEHEEKLFRRLERYIVADRLKKGFWDNKEADVEGFIQFSLSVQNRRKARAGFALENHVAWVFNSCSIRHERGVVTENRNKPDFLFPGRKEYHDKCFPEEKLSLLGVKSTCKDRWRQVLSEAERIRKKHLFTLEPGISENQTKEMKAKDLQLVLPHSLHETYKPEQQSWLFSMKDFINHVKQKEA